jgi:hypothetical protein
MNIIRRLSVYHEDLTVNNIHAIVLVLLPEVISKYLKYYNNNNGNLKKTKGKEFEITSV